MAIFVEKNKKISCKEIKSSDFSILSNENALKILKHLSKTSDYSSNIGEKLQIDKQLVYYYINQLEKAGIVQIVNREMINGSLAKIYSLTAASFVFVISKNWSDFNAEKPVPKVLESFVSDGELDAKIIVGSPDYHGPKRQRARDSYYAIDLALMLGSYLNKTEVKTYLDTEIRNEDLKGNLICVGGPISNLVTAKFLNQLPVEIKGNNLVSKKTKKEYSEPHHGFVAKITNPFDKEKKVLVLAGRSAVGTRAAIIALMKNKDLENGIVEGIDLDGDGRIDDVEVKEVL